MLYIVNKELLLLYIIIVYTHIANMALVKYKLHISCTLLHQDGDTAISIARTMGHSRIMDLLRGKPLNKTKVC